MRLFFEQLDRVFEHTHRSLRIVHLHKIARKIVKCDGIRRVCIYRAVEHIAHVFDLRAKVFVFGRKRPVQFIEKVSAHLRPIFGIERFRFRVKSVFELQHFAEIVGTHKIAHHAREVFIGLPVELHEGCVLFARFFEFCRIFFGRPFEVDIAEQEYTVGIVYVIVKYASPRDLFGLFIICQIVAFHARIFDARFLIVIKIIEDIAVHPFRPQVLLSFAVCARIFEKPFFLQLHAGRFIEQHLRLRIFVRLNERVALFIQTVRVQRAPNKIERKNYQSEYCGGREQTEYDTRNDPVSQLILKRRFVRIVFGRGAAFKIARNGNRDVEHLFEACSNLTRGRFVENFFNDFKLRVVREFVCDEQIFDGEAYVERIEREVCKEFFILRIGKRIFRRLSAFGGSAEIGHGNFDSTAFIGFHFRRIGKTGNFKIAEIAGQAEFEIVFIRFGFCRLFDRKVEAFHFGCIEVFYRNDFFAALFRARIAGMFIARCRFACRPLFSVSHIKIEIESIGIKAFRSLMRGKRIRRYFSAFFGRIAAERYFTGNGSRIG